MALFSSIAISRTQTLIDRTLGTAIGNMTGSGGLAAAFDGVTNQAAAACAELASVTTSYIGKNWGTPKLVNGFRAYAPNNVAFNGNASQITVTLLGNSTNDTATATTLGSVGPTADSTGLVITKLTGITAALYQYHWLKLTADLGGANNRIAEAQFFEDV